MAHSSEELATLKITELRELAKAQGDEWLTAHLDAPVSKAKKADLVAALAEHAADRNASDGRRKQWDPDTLARVVALRHDEHLSWRSIAEDCGWASPGTARRAYRAATGHSGTLPRLPGKGGRPTATMVAGEDTPVHDAPAEDSE